MQPNKGVGTFFFSSIAFILGTTLLNQFDFENMTYPRPGLGVIYLVTFLAAISFLIRNRVRP